MVRSVLVALVLAACAHPPPPPRPAPCPSATPRVPDEDAAVRRWKERIAANRVAADPAALPELLAFLASPDPVRRDAIAFTLLEKWIIAGDLPVAELRSVRDRLVERMRSGDSVFARSFAALTLGAIVKRDLVQPFLTDDERRALLAAARGYADRETDLRGYTEGTGWAHAAAHTADLLVRLAREPSFTAADRAIVLDTVAAFAVRRHGFNLHDGEDGRLAQAVLAAVRAGVDHDKLVAFLAQLRAPLEEPGFDPVLFAAQRNARNLLFTLYVQASLAQPRTPADTELVTAVTAAIQ